MLTARNARGGLGSATNFAIVRNSAQFGSSGTAQATASALTRIAFKPFGNPGGGDADDDPLTFKRGGGPKNGVAAFVKNADGSSALVYQARKGFVGVEVIQFV